VFVCIFRRRRRGSPIYPDIFGKRRYNTYFRIRDSGRRCGGELFIRAALNRERLCLIASLIAITCKGERTFGARLIHLASKGESLTETLAPVDRG